MNRYGIRILFVALLATNTITYAHEGGGKWPGVLYAFSIAAIACVAAMAFDLFVAARKLSKAMSATAHEDAADGERGETAAGVAVDPPHLDIGDRTFYPRKATLPVMKAVLHEQVGPPEPEQIEGTGTMQRLSPDYQISLMESIYRQLAVLLTDENGEHPDPDYLGVYLSLDDANTILQALTN